jgi:hypothetical protein
LRRNDAHVERHVVAPIAIMKRTQKDPAELAARCRLAFLDGAPTTLPHTQLEPRRRPV